MKGLEIQINDEAPIVAATDRKVIFLSSYVYGNDTADISVIGFNHFYETIYWLQGRGLQIGDKVKIKVVETDNATKQVERVMEKSREELEKIYESTKSYLQKEGVLI